MNKTFKLYGIIFVVVLAVLVVLEMNKTEVIDWRKTYDPQGKSPFGLFVFDQEAQELFHQKLKKSTLSPYDYYTENKHNKPHNILIVTTDFDQESWNKILNEVDKGSDLMLVNGEYHYSINDSLSLEMERINYEDINTLWLTDPQFKNDSLYIDKFPSREGFDFVKKNVEVLGGASAVTDIGANFIKINFGKGHIYYHTEPLFLTNYYLLKPQNERYLQDVFSYLPNREVIWFNEKETHLPESELSFVLANPPLRYAWYLLLAGLLLFVIFNAKRKQRIVPIISPPKNKSVEFVKSIGNLYLQEGNFHDMMAKKAQYFLYRVRAELMIETNELDDDFIKKLHLKTGKSIDKIKEAIELITKARDPYSSVMREDLIRMNTLLNDILK